MIQMRRWKCGMAVGFWVGVVVVGLTWSTVGSGVAVAQDSCQPDTICADLASAFTASEDQVSSALAAPGVTVPGAGESEVTRAALYAQRGQPSQYRSFSQPGQLFEAAAEVGIDLRPNRGSISPKAASFLAEAQCHITATDLFEALQDSAQSPLRATDTATPNDTVGSASSLRNLLGLFGIGFTEDEDNEGIFSADLSFILPNTARERNAKLTLTTDSDPEVSSLVRMRLTNDEMEIDEDALSFLEDRLGDGDDLTLAFDWTYLSKSIGRSPKVHKPLRDVLEKQLAMEAWNALQSKNELPGLLRAVGVDPRLKGNQVNITARLVSDLATRAVKKEVEEGKLEAFDALVNNQPQLIVGAKYRDRDELVGSDETSVSITWEQPLGPNLNRFWAQAGNGTCFADLYKEKNARDSCIQKLERYLEGDSGDTKERTQKATSGFRSSFSLEYKDVGDLDFVLPVGDNEDPVTFEGGEDLTIRAGIGRSFGAAPEPGDGEADVIRPARLDLDLSFTNSSDDDNTPEELKRVDRFRAELKYTLRYGKVNFPISVVYFNKPEFLALEPDVNDEVTARIGIKYTLPNGWGQN